MLGILPPYDRMCQQRDAWHCPSVTDRPFKPYYPHRPSPSPASPSFPHHQPSYYSPATFGTSGTPSQYIRAMELQRHQDVAAAASAVAAANSDAMTKMDCRRFSGASSQYDVSSCGGQYGPGSLSSSSFGLYNGMTNLFESPPQLTIAPSMESVSGLHAGSPFGKSFQNKLIVENVSSSSLRNDDDIATMTMGMNPKKDRNRSGHSSFLLGAVQDSSRGGQGSSGIGLVSTTADADTDRRVHPAAAMTSSSSTSGDTSSPDGVCVTSGRRRGREEVEDATPRLQGVRLGGVGSRNRRSKKCPIAVPQEQKDAYYWDKRRKNNESAKRSREARRRQEMLLAKHLSTLEQEYVQLKADIAVFSNEIEQIRMYVMSNSFNERKIGEQQQLEQHSHHSR